MIINIQHKLCRAFDRLLKSETHFKIYVHGKRLGLTILAYHIIYAPADARSRDLPEASALPLRHGPPKDHMRISGT